MMCRTFVIGVMLIGALFSGEAVASIVYVSAVKDAAGNPVAGAAVEASTGVTAVTDADGAFRLEGLPEGISFSMKVSKVGYVNAWWPEQQSATDILVPTRYMTLYTPAEAAEFGAVPGKGLIRGRMRNLIGDEPLEGVTVTAVNALDTSVTYPVVVSGSSYRITGLDDGAAVLVTASKYPWSFPQRLCIARADSVTFSSLRGRLLTYPSQTVSGLVVDEVGVPVAGAAIAVSAAPSAAATSGSDGRFTIYDIPGGLEYYLAIAKEGFATTYPRPWHRQQPPSASTPTAFTPFRAFLPGESSRAKA